MRKLAVAAAVVFAVLVVFARPVRPAPLGPTPVVIELFTSQGCSSCPPADALLHTLAIDPALHGKVIPLAFHVDYWNGAGWRDPFSSRQWTARQMGYVRQLGLPSAYTPQLVVNGKRQTVGSNAAAVRSEIESASTAVTHAKVSVTVEGSDAVVTTAPGRDGLELIVLETEDGVVTRVEGGENGGRTLSGDAVVRRMVRAGRVTRDAGSRRVPLSVDPSWRRPNVTVVALLQDPKTLQIETAASTRLR